MFYLVGGLIGMFFYAFYLALMVMVWAIGATITGIGVIVLATIEYFTNEEEPQTKKTYSKYYKQFEVKK